MYIVSGGDGGVVVWNRALTTSIHSFYYFSLSTDVGAHSRYRLVDDAEYSSGIVKSVIRC